MSSLTKAAPATLRILGIDPGLQTTGFGVLDMTGSKLQYVASGVIETTREEMGNLPARLKVIYDGIREITERYQPDVASVEIVFVNINPQATLLLGQARGCCVTALVSSGLPVAEYTALQMKQSVTGHGRAAKSQIQEMVKHLQGRKFVEFENLFDPTLGTPVLVVTFIALLELAKETLIEITQAEAFAPIYVRLAYTPN